MRKVGGIIALIVGAIIVLLGWLGNIQTVMAEWRGEGVLGVMAAYLWLLETPYPATVMFAFAVVLLLSDKLPRPRGAARPEAILSRLTPIARELLSEVPAEGWISVMRPREGEPVWRQPPTVYRPNRRSHFSSVDPEQRLAELEALEVELVHSGLVADEKGDGKAYCPTLTGWEVARVLARAAQLEMEREHGRLSDNQFSLLIAMTNPPGGDLPKHLRDRTGLRDWTLEDFAACWQTVPQAFRSQSGGTARLGTEYVRVRTIAERSSAG